MTMMIYGNSNNNNNNKIIIILVIIITADFHDNPLLVEFDNILRSRLFTMLNMDLSDTQWLRSGMVHLV